MMMMMMFATEMKLFKQQIDTFNVTNACTGNQETNNNSNNNNFNNIINNNKEHII